jgi:hypothetical protein
MTPELAEWMARVERQQRINTALNAAVIVALVVVVFASCGSAPVPRETTSGLVGTPTPTPDPRDIVGDVVYRPRPSDGAANAYARLIPTPTPTPTPDPTPTPPARVAPHEATATSVQAQAGGSLEALVCSMPWDCETALRIMWCESHGQNVQNAGGGPYVGPFQVGLFHFRSGEDPWHVPTNVAVAYRVYLSSGWGAWSCY